MVVDYPFVTKRLTWIIDHDPSDPAGQRCRFCGRAKSEDVIFKKKKAHAIPECLGNKTIRTKNECIDCNSRFGEGIENHLGNRLDFLRSVTQVKGKDGAPSYKTPSGTMGIEHPKGKQHFVLTNKELFEKAAAAGGASFSFELPTDALSAKHIPLEAFKALVKIACSICPRTQLSECRPAIQWIMTGESPYPPAALVLKSFRSGPSDAFKSRVVLLRRKQPNIEPYLWCMLQVLNHGFQFFVPFCPADTQILKGRVTIPAMPYCPMSTPIDPPHDKFEWRQEDWSSSKTGQISYKAGFHVQKAWVVKGANESG
ncbi:MAG TPA: hypothetical protein VHD36_09650 [Pirellulales bacterium]|nr:hypothetical protein [Pirellulales bacterium]